MRRERSFELQYLGEERGESGWMMSNASVSNFLSNKCIFIDQARGQDGCILAEFSFCVFTSSRSIKTQKENSYPYNIGVFMDRDEVEVHKNAKRERGHYPAILTELAWSIKDLLYGIKSTEKIIFVPVYFRALKRKPVICKSYH